MVGERVPLTALAVFMTGITVMFVAARLTQPGGPGGIPNGPPPPMPAGTPIRGCPPEGRGSDPDLNRRKNRDDRAAWRPVAFAELADLPWPRSIERQRRGDWRPAAARQVARYEGLPVSVEGHVAGARLEGPEACNCGSKLKDERDIHVWLTDQPGESKDAAVVCEVTPRSRASHPGWTVALFDKLARDETRVRLSGWLMLDQEHPEQLGHGRYTLWEVHPVLEVEVESGTGWAPAEGVK